jgi:hypothetical protein
MGLRFRKSLRILPGVCLNFSKSGVSASLGVRGATVNIGPRGTKYTVGLPGTGFSFSEFSPRTSKTREHVSAERDYTSKFALNVEGPGENITSEPRETAFRIAALLAAASIGGAGIDEVEARIAGILPEKISDRVGCIALAQRMTHIACGLDGTAYKGTAAIRRAMTSVGIGNLDLLPDAVAAVRASLKVRPELKADHRYPVEWYFEGGEVHFREYEAASFRARVLPAGLVALHARQIEVGKQRLSDHRAAENVRAARSRLFAKVRAIIFFVFVGLLVAIALFLFVAVWLGGGAERATSADPSQGWRTTINGGAP